MTQKRQQEEQVGPKKDIVVQIPNCKYEITATKKVGALFNNFSSRIKQLLLIITTVYKRYIWVNVIENLKLYKAKIFICKTSLSCL